MIARLLHGVVPIRSNKVFIETPKPHPVPVQHHRDEQSALAESIYAPTPLELVLEGGDELYYLKTGIPRTTLRDLRRGRWVVQAQLDHDANRDEARDLLAAAFSMNWRKRHTLRARDSRQGSRLTRKGTGAQETGCGLADEL